MNSILGMLELTPHRETCDICSSPIYQDDVFDDGERLWCDECIDSHSVPLISGITCCNCENEIDDRFVLFDGRNFWCSECISDNRRRL